MCIDYFAFVTRTGIKRKFILETFRFQDENDYEYEIFSIASSARAWGSDILAGKHGSRRHSTTSFSQRVVVAGGGLSNVRSFSILQSGEGSTSFNNDNSSNFSCEKKYNEEFRGVYFLTIREKTLNQTSYSSSFSSANIKVCILIWTLSFLIGANERKFSKKSRNHSVMSYKINSTIQKFLQGDFIIEWLHQRSLSSDVCPRHKLF